MVSSDRTKFYEDVILFLLNGSVLLGAQTVEYFFKFCFMAVVMRVMITFEILSVFYGELSYWRLWALKGACKLKQLGPF